MTSESKKLREAQARAQKKREDWAAKCKAQKNKYEGVLWEYLKACQMGVNFRPQVALGDTKYVADFYCSQLLLDIEVDGGIHRRPEKQLRDRRRDEKLESMGIRVYRIATDALKTKAIYKTLARIRMVIDERREELGEVSDFA